MTRDVATKPIIFDRRGFTPWIIEVHDERISPTPVEGFYATCTREDRSCEKFALYPVECDFALCEIRIFSGGEIALAVFAAVFVRVRPRDKTVEITLIDPQANRMAP